MFSKVTSFILMTSMYVALMPTCVVGVPGGWKPVSPTEPGVQEAAKKASAILDEARTSTMIHLLLEVTSAEVQIVKGKNYRLALKLGETNCFRTPTVDVKNCSIVKIVKVEQCVVTVLVWQHKTTLKKFNCPEEKIADGEGIKVGNTGGGEIDIDVNREDVNRSATFATEEMTRRSKGSRVQLKRVVKATGQLVAEVLYRLTLEVTVTSAGDKEGKKDTCKVIVSVIAWRTPRYILKDYKCDLLTL